MEETIRLNKEQLKNDNLAFQEQQKATQAGVGATFSESRLGASTSSAGQASQVAQEGIARQTETFSNQLQQNSLNLSNLERSLVRAQEDGDTEAQDAILAQVDAIQQENLDIQA